MPIHRLTLVCSVLAVAVYLTAALHVARTAGATTDELPHIVAGVYYLRGELRLNQEHPPLTKVLAALALPSDERVQPLPAALPSTEVQWELGRAYLYNAPQPAMSLLLRARLPIILLNSLLIVALALATTSLAGPLAACIAVFLAALCPLWLAHSTLVTTDASASLFFFASAALAGWLLGAESRRSKLWAASGLALSLAGALATKYSMLSALCFIPLGFAIDAARLRRWQGLPWLVGSAFGGAVLGIGLAWGWPPAIDRYIDGVGSVGANHRKDAYFFYAFGELFQGRTPLYFARALLVKVSLPALVLAVLAPAFWLAARGRSSSETLDRSKPWACFVVPPLAYYLLIGFNAPALGVRYVLPVLPFLFVAGAYAGAELWRRGRLRWLLLPLAAAHVLSLTIALRTAPLAFFNGLICSTSDLPPCLDDSNVDWGQALPDLARYRDQRFPNTPLRIFYFGSSWPEAYMKDVTEAQPIELWSPQRALYAVSLHFTARLNDEAFPIKLRPVEVVAGTYAIYDLRE